MAIRRGHSGLYALVGRGSVEPRAAIDVDGLAGDKPAVVADQKQAGGGDFVDVPLTAEGDAGCTRRVSAVPFGGGSSGMDAAGRDEVGADVVPGEFNSQRARHPDEAHLCRRYMSPSAAAGEGTFAGKEQDPSVAVLDHRGDDRPGAVHRPVEDDTP